MEREEYVAEINVSSKLPSAKHKQKHHVERKA
jgi:hypothetical protein